MIPDAAPITTILEYLNEPTIIRNSPIKPLVPGNPTDPNINIIKTGMEKLGLDMEKTFTNLEKYGNTAGASVPIAMHEAMNKGLIKEGSLVVTAAFGGGLSWGANVIQF